MPSLAPVVFIRYWGGLVRSRRQGEIMAAEFEPLVKRGWKCCLVLQFTPEDPSWVQDLSNLGVRFICRPRPRRNFDFSCIRSVMTLCRECGATVIQIDNLHTSPLIGAWLAGVPVRVWVKRAMNQAFEECRQPGLKERIAISVRLSCRLASRVICVSRAVADELAAMGIPKSKLAVHINPRKLGKPDSNFDREAVRKSWGCSPENVVIVTIGRSAPVKAWDILLPAFAQVSEAVPAARLVLVGAHDPDSKGAFCRRLMDFIRQNQLGKKIVFTGHMGEVGRALRSADIFVLPSRSEGCSSAPVEAFQAGLPVVLTRVGHSTEIVQDGVNGFIVERCDVKGLAEALRKLAADDTLRAQFASRARVPDHIPSLELYAAGMASEFEALLPATHKRLAEAGCVPGWKQA